MPGDGALHLRSRIRIPDPHGDKQSENDVHPPHWPSIGLGPCDPYGIHNPPRHHRSEPQAVPSAAGNKSERQWFRSILQKSWAQTFHLLWGQTDEWDPNCILHCSSALYRWPGSRFPPVGKSDRGTIDRTRIFSGLFATVESPTSLKHFDSSEYKNWLSLHLAHFDHLNTP